MVKQFSAGFFPLRVLMHNNMAELVKMHTYRNTTDTVCAEYSLRDTLQNYENYALQQEEK